MTGGFRSNRYGTNKFEEITAAARAEAARKAEGSDIDPEQEAYRSEAEAAESRA